MTGFVNRVQEQVRAQIQNNEIILPSLPEVAFKVMKVAGDPYATIIDLANVISNDISLSVNLIKLINGPVYRRDHFVADVQTAVSLLGMTYSSNLAVGLALKQLFQSSSQFINEKMNVVWEQSLNIAERATALAINSNLRPDLATLAGLVHQIGTLPLFSYAETDPDIARNETALDTLISELHTELGSLILSKWGFPSELIFVPRDYLKFDREVPDPDYVDLVLIATLQNSIDTNKLYSNYDWSHISAFERLGLAPYILNEK